MARPNQRQHTGARRDPTCPARTLGSLHVSADSPPKSVGEGQRTQILLVKVVRQKNGAKPVYMLIGW